jgi:hypothetical protein
MPHIDADRLKMKPFSIISWIGRNQHRNRSFSPDCFPPVGRGLLFLRPMGYYEKVGSPFIAGFSRQKISI